MISAIAIDDEPLALELLQLYAQQVDGLELKRTFTSTGEAARYLRKFPVDLLFLDIRMPDSSGLDFYKSISPGKMVIFTTAHREYAVDGFEVNAVDYLLKPIHPERFALAVQKAMKLLETRSSHTEEQVPMLYVRSEYALVPVPLKDILYIEGLEDYVKIFHAAGRPLVTRLNLKGILQKLPQPEFIRVHRSYIVSVAHITSIRNRKILIGEQVIPIGETYSEQVDALLRPKP